MALFAHDCPRCRLVGSTNRVDVYICETGFEDRSISIRFGDEPHEYKCMGGLEETRRVAVVTGIDGDYAVAVRMIDAERAAA